MSHTPGPWKVDDRIFKMGYFLRIRNTDNEPIAEVTQCDTPDSELANANLIAAAPDLLEALEAVEFVNEYCPWCNEHYADGHYPDCRHKAAIAKAKGESL